MSACLHSLIFTNSFSTGLNKKKVEKGLKKKGFKSASGDHRYFVFYIDVKIVATRSFKNPPKGIDVFLLNQ
ncbi:MAG: hypothetical protein K8R37_06795 [Bacteroidales bacterium]|nr:hypothetical protein [Bacteroidales bacterium]